ncbi:hypothetical protein [Paenibacillus sp. NPDC055715]
MNSHDEFESLLKSIVDQHRKHGLMTIDLSSTSGISSLEAI